MRPQMGRCGDSLESGAPAVPASEKPRSPVFTLTEMLPTLTDGRGMKDSGPLYTDSISSSSRHFDCLRPLSLVLLAYNYICGLSIAIEVARASATPIQLSVIEFRKWNWHSTPSRGQSDFGLNGDLGARQRAL